MAEIHPHGPRLVDAFKHPPVLLIGMWAVCGVIWIATVSIYIIHQYQIKKAPPSILRHCYLDIARLGVIFSCTSFITLFNLRPAYLAELVRKFYEAYVLHTFFVVLISLLGGYTEALRKFKEQGNRKFLAVPPLGCFFRVCCKQKPVTKDVLVWCTRGTEQYVYVVLAMAVWNLWVEIDPPLWNYNGKTFTMVVSTVSMLTAMYSLMILFFLSRSLLSHHRPGFKFGAIKFVIAISSSQAMLLSYLIPHSDDPMYDTVALERMWNSALLCVESLLLTWMLWRAFPYSDLIPSHASDDELIDSAGDEEQAGLDQSLLGNTMVARFKPEFTSLPPSGVPPFSAPPSSTSSDADPSDSPSGRGIRLTTTIRSL